MYSTKSGSKRIFSISQLDIPPYVVDIYDQVEFYTHLTKLIFNNKFVNRWIFKIDNEFRGRGTAYIDVENLVIIKELRKKGESLTEL